MIYEIPVTNFADLILNEIFKHTVEYYENGQKKVEQFYTDGIILLKEIHYYEDGRISQICNYKANTNEVVKYHFGEEKLQSGMQICYHENGTVQSQKYFVDGKINCEEKLFSESGQLLEVVSYQKGIKSGYHKIYNEKGILLSEICFEKNLPSGISKFYYDSGLTKAVINFQDGIKQGISRLYYENGILKIEENFDQGIHEGFLKTFYQSGGIKENWSLHKGLPEGNCSFYYRSGMIFGTKNYKNGKEEGIAKFFYENGKVKEEINYSNGLKDGLHRSYNSQGGLEKEAIYQNGELIQENEIKPKQIKIDLTPSQIRKQNAIRTMNYVGLSSAALISIYLLYSFAIYLFG